jgi:bifunctional non-homologous end joining protein LigD
VSASSIGRAKIKLPKYRPQLAKLARNAPSGPGWLHELKYDGYRVGCVVKDGEVTLVGGRGEDCTARFPEVVEAAKRVKARQALLDGEIALVLPDGRTSLEALEQAASAAARRAVSYFVFDLLHLDGENVAALALEERKQRCEKLLAPLNGKVIRYSAHFEADGPTVFQRACELGAPGIVSKRRDRPYRAGRSADWLTTKCAPAALRPAGTSVAGVTITTPERPVYPELGLTKLDLARYYADIAERMLPYVENRPLTLVRCEKGVRSPDALRADCKFLRHEPGWHRWVKAPIRRVNISEQKKLGEYLVVDSKAALVALAQGDILEVHVWNSTVDQLETPDRIVFDLDPGVEVPWERVSEAARWLRDELARVELAAWVKLTGGKGLHVVVPFVPERSWDDVFAFARKTAEAFVRRDPAAFTLEYGKQGRARKILLDYKRNHRAAVAVAAYSARARINASISLPVSWHELATLVAPDAWTIVNVRERLKRVRRDPWKDFWTSTQRLPADAGAAAHRVGATFNVT